MKISCTQENLNQGLFVTSHIASKNSTLPILNNVLIQSEDGVITLSSTNLEIGVRCIIRGKVDGMGEFTVNSRLFADYISLLPKERVDLEMKKTEAGIDVLEVNCGNHHTKINGQEASDYPLIPQIDKNNSYKVKHSDLREAISQVIFSVSVSEARPEINGVLFNFLGKHLILTATDSYRLAERKINAIGDGDIQVIVPAKTLQELQRILGSIKDPASLSEVDDIDVYVSDNQIMFSFGNIELISRLVEGKYPEYQQIIPSSSVTVAAIESSELIKAIKATSLFTRSGIFDVLLTFDSQSGQIIISSSNNQLGENTSKVGGKISGGSNTISVNYRYLLDGLSNMPTTQLDISVIDAENPCIVRPSSSSDYLYIVMPLLQ